MVNAAGARSSRDRLLAAAAREFAANGYAGAGVDRIARAARLNKAMIYYHFKNKADIYRAIVRDVFEEVRLAAEQVASSSSPPDEKIRGFIQTIADVASRRPHFPAIWLREFAGGARHMDTATLKVAASVVALLAGIIAEGQKAGMFRPVNPLSVHIGIIAPILLYLVSAEARTRLGQAALPGAAQLTLEQIVTHVTESTLGSLRRRAPRPAGE